MSEEIVERLKAEGQLTRNTGTNSIRAVRIQMDKFEAIFETISEQVTLQTKLLADMVETSMDQLRINAETSEREKVRQQREDLADAQEEDRDEPDDAAPARAEREGPGLFSMLSGMGIGKLLMGGALLGAGLFAAYNIAKGFVDERTGGGWSAFEETLTSTLSEMDWQGLKNDILSIGTTVKELSIKLAELLGMIKGFIENPWSLFAIGAGLGAGKFLGGRALSALFGTGAGAGAAAGAAAGGGGGFLSKLLGFGLRAAPPTALAAAILTPSDLGDGTVSGQAEERLAAQGVNRPSESIRNVSPELYDRLNREYEEQLQAEMDRFNDMAAEVAAAEVAAADAARTPEEEARLAELRAQNMERDRLAREQRLRDAAREYARRNQGLFNPDVYVEQFERKRRTDEFNRSMEAQDTPDEYDVEELSSSLLDEATRNADRFFADPNYKATIGSSGPSTFEQIQQMLADFERDPMNFDSSKYQFGNDERVSEAASGGTGTAVFFDYNPNISVAPVSVQGGPNISSNVVYGSGGGDRSRDAYGITN